MTTRTIIDIIEPKKVYTAQTQIRASYLYIKGYPNSINRSLSLYWGHEYYDYSAVGNRYIKHDGWYISAKPANQAGLDKVCQDLSLLLDNQKKLILLPVGTTFDIKWTNAYRKNGLNIRGLKNMQSKIVLNRFSATIPWSELNNLTLKES